MSIARKVVFKKITVTVPTTGTPVPISPTTLYATDFEIHVPSSNGGTNIYIGDETVDSTWIPRAIGESINFTHGSGTFFGPKAVVAYDLSKVFVDADINGDQVIVQYIAGVR